MKRKRRKTVLRKPRVLKRFVENDDEDERDEEIGQPNDKDAPKN